MHRRVSAGPPTRHPILGTNDHHPIRKLQFTLRDTKSRCRVYTIVDWGVLRGAKLNRRHARRQSLALCGFLPLSQTCTTVCTRYNPISDSYRSTVCWYLLPSELRQPGRYHRNCCGVKLPSQLLTIWSPISAPAFLK